MLLEAQIGKIKMSFGTNNWEVKTYRNKLQDSIVSSELISDVLLLVKLTLRQPLLSSRTTDTCWLNPKFFAAQINIWYMDVKADFFVQITNNNRKHGENGC